jgi:hypothetical protein
MPFNFLVFGSFNDVIKKDARPIINFFFGMADFTLGSTLTGKDMIQWFNKLQKELLNHVPIFLSFRCPMVGDRATLTT